MSTSSALICVRKTWDKKRGWWWVNWDTIYCGMPKLWFTVGKSFIQVYEGNPFLFHC